MLIDRLIIIVVCVVDLVVDIVIESKVKIIKSVCVFHVRLNLDIINRFYFSMNVITFPTVVGTNIVHGKEIKVISDYHRMLINRLNLLGIYPMVSSERRPTNKEDLPNKNGVIVSLFDKCIIPISDWMGEKVFAVVFYNFETTRRGLMKVCRLLKTILFACRHPDYYQYSINKLKEDGYFGGTLKLQPVLKSDTWTGTKIIENGNILKWGDTGKDYIKEEYPVEFLDLK